MNGIDLRDILEKCEEFGADSAEVYAKSIYSLGVEIEKNNIKYVESKESEGIGIRVISGGTVGFASTSDPNQLTRCIKDSLEHSRMSSEELKSFPCKSSYPEVSGINDQNVWDMQPRNLVEGAESMICAASQEDTYPISGSISASASDVRILNSSGLDVGGKETLVGANMEASFGSDQDKSSSFEFDISRAYDIDFEYIGKKAAKMAKKSRGGSKTSLGCRDVILSPIALGSILGATLIPAMDPDEVWRRRSKIPDLISEKIGPEDLNIADNGLLPKGVNSRGFDDEGVPSTKNPVVKNGIMKDILYDCRTAEREGKESTSNAVRSSYSTPPSTSPRNLVIEPVSSTKNIQDEEDIYVRTVLGAHTANSVTGDFSVASRESFEIEDGKQKPLSGIMLYGNLYEMLSDIKEIGNDTRKIDNFVLPSVKTSLEVSN